MFQLLIRIVYRHRGLSMYMKSEIIYDRAGLIVDAKIM